MRIIFPLPFVQWWEVSRGIFSKLRNTLQRWQNTASASSLSWLLDWLWARANRIFYTKTKTTKTCSLEQRSPLLIWVHGTTREIIIQQQRAPYMIIMLWDTMLPPSSSSIAASWKPFGYCRIHISLPFIVCHYLKPTFGQTIGIFSCSKPRRIPSQPKL